MESVLLDGLSLARSMEETLIEEVCQFTETYEIPPTLAIISEGDNGGCKKYVELKKGAAERLGIRCYVVSFDDDPPAEEIVTRIHRLNNMPTVHGVMVQHPVSDRLRSCERLFFDAIDPAKDVDGLTSLNFGKLALHTDPVAFQPATAKGIMTLLDHYNIGLSGRRVGIIGSSPILGLPLSMLMHNRGATVSITNIHTDFSHLNTVCQHSDILVGACGQKHLINKLMMNYGAILIDAGCSPRIDGVFNPNTYDHASFYTKPTGGVGPMTVITLLQQTLEAARYSVRYEDGRR